MEVVETFLKRRIGKNSGRLFLHDKELKDTVFKSGSHYRYDVKDNKLFIWPAVEGNTVSQRDKDGLEPLIDIRDKASFAAFEGCAQLWITIYGDKVVIEGYVEEDVDSSDPASDTSLRKKVEIIVSLNELRAVVGLDRSLIEFLSRLSPSHSLRQAEIPLKVMSIFSGAGMLDVGFRAEGFEIVFALDADKAACDTYKNNIGDHIRCCDITKLQTSDIPSVPVVIGGSPCQGYSNANRQTHYLDNPKNLLVKEYIRVVKQNPYAKVFVLENVPQLLRAGDRAFLREIEEKLSDFEITAGVLSAADMGSAQQRQRAFVIGSKIGKIELPRPVLHVLNTVRNAFRGITDDMANQRDFSMPKMETLERIRQIPAGGNWRDLASPQDPRHHSNYLKRLSWDSPSITLANVRKSLILHPSEDRTLSVREMARLFDLPDSFEFMGSLSEKQQQAANGVPVKLASAVARVVKEAINAFNLSRTCTAI